MVSDPPLVSVVLPCFNAEAHLPAALESIRSQTETRFEVLAVDDGSTDATRRILETAAAADVRVRVLSNARNRGIIETLNRGVSEARGAFIARMDADDVARSTRVARQLAVFERHPGTGIVGSGARLIDASGQVVGRRPPRCLGPEGARFLSLVATPVMHPTVLGRAALFRAHPYRSAPETLHAEDYELFARMVRAGVAFRNVEEPLLDFRLTPSGVSRTHEATQIEHFVRCAGAHLAELHDLRPAPPVLRVLLNRIDDQVGGVDVAAGLRLVGELERRHAAACPAEGNGRMEIAAVAGQQRVDILIQALRRGRASARARAALLLPRHGWSFLSPSGRAYLASKTGPPPPTSR